LKSSGLDDKPEIRLATILGDSRTGLLSDLENASATQRPLVPQPLLDTSGGFSALIKLARPLDQPHLRGFRPLTSLPPPSRVMKPEALVDIEPFHGTGLFD
jgi:hypothetical protein